MKNVTVSKRPLVITAAVAVLFCSAANAPADVISAQFQWNARTGTWPAKGSGETLVGSIAVTADPNTNWSLSGLPSWINVVSGSPWTGSGVVTFRLSENTGPARTATLSVGGSSLEVYQADGRCPTTANPATTRVGVSGASEKTFNVGGNGTCFWNVVPRANWISVRTLGASGAGAVVYSVEEASERRSGAIVAGGAVFTIDQDGPQACDYLPRPLYYDFPAAGGTGTFDLFLKGGCGGWTVTSDSPWVRVITASGSGPGTATYTVEANPHGYARYAVLIVNNQPHFVSQAPSSTPGFVFLQPGPGEGQDTSYGSGYYLNGTPDDPVLTYGGSGDRFSDYFRFDLSHGLPASNVARAHLQLYVTMPAVGDPRLQLWQLTEAWTEASVTASSNPAGVLIRNLPPLRGGWNSIDVTDLYRRWKTGSLPNFGVKIAPEGTPTGARGSLAACEYGDADKRPKLVLTYREEAVGSSIGSQQSLRVVGGTGYQELYHNYDTGATSVSPYTWMSGAIPYEAPEGQWIGIYHYDYAGGRFSQALYVGRDLIP